MFKFGILFKYTSFFNEFSKALHSFTPLNFKPIYLYVSGTSSSKEAKNIILSSQVIFKLF
ncbi:MAG: hypothetical protein LBQ24_04245 [Candidatus Peribacteria bacterium]|nr:hypothetical protein [Candidatus Peribacteria bacterium]